MIFIFEIYYGRFSIFPDNCVLSKLFFLFNGLMNSIFKCFK